MSGMQLPTQETHICQMPRMEKVGEDKMGGGQALTAGGTSAVDRGHPQVRRAGVIDDPELLSWCSSGDAANIGHI